MQQKGKCCKIFTCNLVEGKMKQDSSFAYRVKSNLFMIKGFDNKGH